MIKVDAHQHFWRRSRGDYDWLTPNLAEIYRDFEPHDLIGLLAQNEIDMTIAVQAAASVDETLFLLSLADEYAFIAGVVGWVDMMDGKAPRLISRLAEHRKFKGIRPMVQEIPDHGWMLDPQLSPAFDALVEHGLTFDALVLPWHLPNLLVLLRRYPHLKAIVDHGGKPQIATNELAAWRTDIAAIAAETDALCKLSGLVTEAGDEPTYAQIEPVFAHLYASFGPSRLIWGSDWPVVNLATGYDRWSHITHQLLDPLPANEKDAILGGNACRFYAIEKGLVLQ